MAWQSHATAGVISQPTGPIHRRLSQPNIHRDPRRHSLSHNPSDPSHLHPLHHPVIKLAAAARTYVLRYLNNDRT